MLDSGPSFGALTLNPDGTFNYTHDDSENFADGFTYHANDGVSDSNITTVTIVVTPVNDNPPVANPDGVTVVEGGTIGVLDSGAASVLANDTDADRSTCSISWYCEDTS